MTRMVNSAKRPYRSEFRAERANQTREQILDAVVQVMAGGIASVSIPDVAREAGVAVPTVYYHFRTKHDLLEAVYPHLAGRAGLDRASLPRTVEEFREWVHGLFDRTDSLGPVARAAMASMAADEVRRLSMPDRLAASRRFVASVGAALADVDQERIARLLVILTSSSAQRLWTDHLGATASEAADDVDWVLRAALAASTPPAERWPS